MILATNETKMKVAYDPLYSYFRLFDYTENIPGKRSVYISSVICRDKYRITAIMSLYFDGFLFWMRSGYFR